VARRTQRTVNYHQAIVGRTFRSLAIVALLLPAPLSAASDDDLVPRARGEGHVVLYGAMVGEQANAVAERFRARYGISVDVLRIGVDQIPARIITEERGACTMRT
jgi:hypothetical protein